MKITSPAFESRGDIPAKHTFDGENISPPLRFDNIPPKAQSLVLIVEDIDSPIGPFTHWVVWNIPAKSVDIEENRLPPGAMVGVNGFGEARYGGPCPPLGRHRYQFRLYALDIVLDVMPPERRDIIESEMEDNIIGRATLTGHYQAAAG